MPQQGMLNSDGVTVSTAVVDCGNREQIETWADMICAENDSLDFLFNNAGVGLCVSVPRRLT